MTRSTPSLFESRDEIWLRSWEMEYLDVQPHCALSPRVLLHSEDDFFGVNVLEQLEDFAISKLEDFALTPTPMSAPMSSARVMRVPITFRGIDSHMRA